MKAAAPSAEETAAALFMTEKAYNTAERQSSEQITGPQERNGKLDYGDRLKGGYFVAVPLEILTSHDLSPGAKVVWAVLAWFQRYNGSCWPGLRTVAQKARLSVDWTKKSLSELVKKGYVEHSYDRARNRHIYRVKVPADAVQDYAKSAEEPGLLAWTVELANAPSAPSKTKQPKQEEKAPTTESMVWDLDDIPITPELAKKYANGRAEDALWNGFTEAPGGEKAVQNEKEGDGVENNPTSGRNQPEVGLKPTRGRVEINPIDEASAQSRTATAETEYNNEYKHEGNQEIKSRKNLAEALTSKGEGNKPENNFQLGQEEKSRLETKNSSAESEILEQTSKAEFPSPSNGSSSPSAGFSQAKGSYSESFELDPRGIPGAVYAKLPVWARFALSGLSDLRRELAELEAASNTAQGEERVELEARMKEIKGEINYSEASLAQALAEIGYFVAGTPVTAGAEARG